MSKRVSVADDAINTATEREEVREEIKTIYLEFLYDKEENPKIEDLQVEDGEEVVKRPEVLKKEILLRILGMKKENLGKAAGVDEIAYHQKC